MNILKRRKIILIVLICLTLAFIWGNSLYSKNASSQKSGSVTGIISPFLEFFLGEGNVSEHIVRKLAHFTEFFILGVEFLLFASVCGKVSLQKAANCLFAGLSVAVADETIQIFSGRSSQVQDVLLDFSGAACGILFTFLISQIAKNISKNINRRNAK